MENLQIPDVDASVNVPDVSGDVSVTAPDASLPGVSGEASLPSVGGDLSFPQVNDGDRAFDTTRGNIWFAPEGKMGGNVRTVAFVSCAHKLSATVVCSLCARFVCETLVVFWYANVYYGKSRCSSR